MAKRKIPTIIFIGVLILSIIALDAARQIQLGGNKDEIVLKVLYTSEKKGWINSVAPEFPDWFAERNPGKIKRPFENHRPDRSRNGGLLKDEPWTITGPYGTPQRKSLKRISPGGTCGSGSIH